MNGQLDTCHCCEGLTAQTPVAVKNRPGLSAIAYRVGTHSQFKQSMLAALSDITRPALQNLKTREDDDFSIALLDAAATMGDVLTFYQERIANESYLRTATERRSLLELGRLIGYELRPGVAASAFLAFTMDDTAGAPQETTVDIGTKVQSVPGPNEKAQTFETVEKITARVEWNAIKPQTFEAQQIVNGLQQLYLKGVNTNLQPGDPIVMVGAARESDQNSTLWEFRRLQSVTKFPEDNYTLVTWQDELAKFPMPLGASQVEVFGLRQRAALFGHNAPDWISMPKSFRKAYDPLLTATEWPEFRIQNGQFDLDTVYPKVVEGSWIVVMTPSYLQLHKVNSVTSISRAHFALSAKITRITPDLPPFDLPLRSTTVFVQSDLLEMAEQPITTPITGATIQLAQAASGLVKEQWLAASGKDNATGEAITEIVQISAIDGTTLTVSPPLLESYARESFLLNANVAHATHGETVSEILGSGDASQRYQRFTLKQSPLTYVSAATASGARSALETKTDAGQIQYGIRVNDLLWHEAPTLFGRDPQEHIYVTRTGDDGKTTIEFGDGVTGARLPSGQDNVRATYRKGIGTDGLVKAGQLISLLTRPLGLKSVVNPEGATGAQDRESLDDARTNAPLTVLTLDRTVSLQDYEDFSRAFAGIAKALATLTWDGQTKRVFITVAGPGGAEINADSDTYVNLLAALQQAGDPFVSLRVKSYRPAHFRFAGKVKVNPDYQTDLVLAAVEQALRKQFSFDVRAFGQPVFLSEVIAAVQAVPGVAAVDVDKLYRSGSAATLETRLLAALPEILANGDVAAAELLTLDPAPLDELGVMS
jgi:predicted phage baseplate assembly protein